MDPTDFGVLVASEAATSLFAKIKKHVKYIYKYKDNLKDLEDARVKLDAKKTDASRFVGDIDKKLRDVSCTVALWKSDAEKLLQKAETTISRNNISCINLWSRYSASKHAWELTQIIHTTVETAPDFGTSFDHPIAEGAKFNLRGFTEFDSRKEILNRVLEALKDENVSMCSICGMGGIGKTTMAKKLVQIVEADGLFAKVAMVTVSQDPNFERIQKEIIELLGLTIGESSMPGRAKKLNDWLSNNKTLLILDDVWWQLHDEDFENVGIPSGTKGCKIVVTSRNEDECKKMGSQKNFHLKILDGEEAWDLFIQNAGKCDGNLKETAREIVRECDGLPIAIVTVASALKDKTAAVWDDSLRRLQNSNLQAISGMDKVYSRIRLSYDLLNDQEAQSCFRLCCLFPEDFDVPVEKLIFYGKGLELFEGVDSLKETRDRVDSIIDKLKKSFLLLEGREDGYVKLHDIVRDFAISISTKDEYPYLIRCEKEMKKWPEACQLEKCRAISIICDTVKDGSFVDLRCPNLQLLQLRLNRASGGLLIGLFEGMEGLRVVDLQVRSESPRLTMPKKLRTLLINNDEEGDKWAEPFYFDEILGNNDMKNLEVFSLSYMQFHDFPEEIGQLCNLRCLRLNGRLEYIRPGVLSKLVKLEELRLPGSFKSWGLKVEEGNSINASLSEIESLPLTSIKIGIGKSSVLAEKLVQRITRFQILYGRAFEMELDSNYLCVDEVDVCDATANWMSNLLRKCDDLMLRRVRGLKYIMFQHELRLRGNNGFPRTYFSRLKTLRIEYIDSLEEIWDGPCLRNIQQPCFMNLTQIFITCCPRLKHVFPLSVTTQLKQLQGLEILSCQEIEEIFYKDNQIIEESSEIVGEGDANHVIVLPRLKMLRLNETRKLRSLHKGNHAIECPSLEKMIILGCPIMEALSHGSVNAPTTKQLELTEVRYLENIIQWLHFEQGNGIPQLTELSISKCHEMKYLVDPILPKPFFSPLEKLEIDHMDSLEEIWHGPYHLSNIQPPCFPSNLTWIAISNCPKLKRAFPLSMAIELRQLQQMHVRLCEEMEEIFYKDQIEEESREIVDERKIDHVIVLPRLKLLYLIGLPKLRVLYNGNHAIEYPLLKELSIECDNMEALPYGSFSAPKIKKLKLIGARSLENIIKLLYFEQGNGIPQLTELSFFQCHEMKHLVDAIANPILLNAFFSPLKKLWIVAMDVLEEIWNGPYLSNIQQPSFLNLTLIWILNCPKLKHVFPVSVATQLEQLRELNIHLCKEMEEMFYKDQGMEERSVKLDEKEADDATDAIILPQLRFLLLWNLSKLRIMYDGNHAMELPLLEKFEISGCDKIEALSKGSFKAPKLEVIVINAKKHPCGQDLNTTLKIIIEDKHKNEERGG